MDGLDFFEVPNDTLLTDPLDGSKYTLLGGTILCFLWEKRTPDGSAYSIFDVFDAPDKSELKRPDKVRIESKTAEVILKHINTPANVEEDFQVLHAAL